MITAEHGEDAETHGQKVRHGLEFGTAGPHGTLCSKDEETSPTRKCRHKLQHDRVPFRGRQVRVAGFARLPSLAGLAICGGYVPGTSTVERAQNPLSRNRPVKAQ